MRHDHAATDIRPSAWTPPLPEHERLRAKAIGQLAEIEARVRQGASEAELLRAIELAIERLR